MTLHAAQRDGGKELGAIVIRRLRHGAGVALRWATRFGRRDAGNVSAIMAVLIVPVVGAMGMATEASNWFLTARSAQNAADSAALAAGNNGGSTTYTYEGQAAAAKYGFTDGQGNVTVAIASGQTCPDGSASCYQATITKKLPIYLTHLAGFGGDTTIGSSPAKQVQVLAMAEPIPVPTANCSLNLGTSSQAFRTNGGNSINLSGCTVYSNGGTTCNGHSTQAASVNAVTSSDPNCPGSAVNALLGTAISDPYAAQASNISVPPVSSCTSPSALTGNVTLTASSIRVCGSGWSVAGSGTITTPSSGTTIYVVDGDLNLNNATVATASGSGVTIVFTGTNSASISHTITGKGTLNIESPDASSGSAWAGYTIYGDPSLTQNVDMTLAGSQQNLYLSGIVYFPHSNLTLNGAVNKSSYGYSCFTLVDLTLLVNGGGWIFQNSQSQCSQQGSTQTFGKVVRVELVR